MELTLREAGCEDLEAHARIPISFVVDRVLEPVPGGGPLDLVERPHPVPWVKDYDAEVGAAPVLWPARFDTSSWRVISAWQAGERVGGLVLFADEPGLDMLDDRSDLALIWDLRVAPAARGRGLGGRLVAAAVEWARARGCRELKVETQSINVGACRLYERQGFELRSVRPAAYPELPDELRLLWYRGVG
jgi:ribosomal protein S18 acetylase RimI-like enzyme